VPPEREIITQGLSPQRDVRDLFLQRAPCAMYLAVDSLWILVRSRPY